MHIHTYEKLWLGLSLLLITGFVATITYGALGAGVEMVDDSGETVDPDALGEHPDFADPGVEQVGPNEYDVYVVAHRFYFEPGSSAQGFDPITVPANSTVNFYITSADVVHGFGVAGTNANTMVVPGEVSELTVEVGEPAEYGIVCNEYCGSGHHTMEGLMQVVPPGEYNGTGSQTERLGGDR
ncbi:MAG: cytochrome c oxidase subunit II [Haloarculaceae archaeon]